MPLERDRLLIVPDVMNNVWHLVDGTFADVLADEGRVVVVVFGGRSGFTFPSLGPLGTHTSVLAHQVPGGGVADAACR